MFFFVCWYQEIYRGKTMRKRKKGQTGERGRKPNSFSKRGWI